MNEGMLRFKGVLVAGAALLGCLLVAPVHAAVFNCTGCHAALLRRKNVHNPAGEGDCLSCHEQDPARFHPIQKKSMRLQAAGATLCYRCHESKSNLKLPHGPLAAGECTPCHDPHHSSNRFLLKETGGALCATCHGSKVVKKFGHSPVVGGECAACHVPHQSDRGMLLKEQAPDLCYSCHGGLFKKKHIHPPVAAGDCLACHDPHQADNPALLKQTGIRLCLECHDDKFTKNRYGHAPVMAGDCFDCHEPHQSDYPKLLKKPGSNLCFSCHDKSIAEGKEVHAPVRRGECVACHLPHGSENPRMLVKPYPESFYLPYAPAHFALCFECHNRDIAQDERTDTLTNFRNGDRNLHYVHVNKPDKGRSCKVCHDPHASGMARLIRPRIPGFGKWDIPIDFTRTDTGGTCVVGCHKPKTYDRRNTVRYR
jgi:predicted CXXCH cytochrome family protein